MNETDERLTRLEARIEAMEATVKWAEEKVAAIAASPQLTKIAKMFGVDLK